MRHDPHTLVEGCLIAGFAMGAITAYIYVRGEFIREREALQRADRRSLRGRFIGKNNMNGWDFDIYRPSRRRRLYLRRGDGAARKPRRQEGPAAPEAAVPGECRPLRLPDDGQQCRVDRGRADDPAPRRGWFAAFGRPNNVGTKLFCISGHVNKPCTVEEAMWIPFRELIETHCGGIRGGWDNLLAVIPGGASVPLVPAEQIIDSPMDFDSLRDLKSGLGTAAVIVMDKSTDIVKAIARLSYFYKHESCGQCTPCREGTGWMWRVMERMVRGEAQKREIDMLLDVTKQIEGHTICALGDAAAWPIQGLIRHFRREIERRIDEFSRNAHRAEPALVAAE